MKKLIFQIYTSLDGYYEDSRREMDWRPVDNEISEYTVDLLNHLETVIFGRKTYEVMAAYWPTEKALFEDPAVAERINSIEKIVFSATLPGATWRNTRLLRGNAEGVIALLKNRVGGDLAIFGSSVLAARLAERELIDEFRILVIPVLLGRGTSLFAGINGRPRLVLRKTRTFRSGGVLLYYSKN